MNLKKYQFIFLIVILAISLLLNIAFIVIFNTGRNIQENIPNNIQGVVSPLPEISSFVPQISPPNAPPPNY
ncbi:MAG TPA: hypothetical protein P5225_00640 [Candidatus Paceibacterota bacterium]|jgi:hypothetical protein|nr:hypothetical protein [Candidatus Paceibacterota bacterium]